MKVTIMMITMMMKMMMVVREMLMERIRDVDVWCKRHFSSAQSTDIARPIKIHLTPCHEGNSQWWEWTLQNIEMEKNGVHALDMSQFSSGPQKYLLYQAEKCKCKFIQNSSSSLLSERGPLSMLWKLKGWQKEAHSHNKKEYNLCSSNKSLYLDFRATYD